jgi:hypothetical protein
VTSLGPGTRTLPKHNLHRKKPYTKPSKTTPNRPRKDQQHHDPKTHESSSSPEANPTSGIHQSDQSHTPVRPVKPGQLGMNSTRGSTPPNPNLDLPNRSMDLCKILSIAKILSTKTRQIKRNRRNPVKNSSNPRAPKTPKSGHLTHGFGRGIKGKRTMNGSHIHPYQIPKSKVPKTHQEIHQERTPKITTKTHKQSPKHEKNMSKWQSHTNFMLGQPF